MASRSYRLDNQRLLTKCYHSLIILLEDDEKDTERYYFFFAVLFKVSRAVPSRPLLNKQLTRAGCMLRHTGAAMRCGMRAASSLHE